MEKYVKCLEIAIVAHKDQKRRSGKPFIEHPMAVSSQFYDEMMKSIAILHLNVLRLSIEHPLKIKFILFKSESF